MLICSAELLRSIVYLLKFFAALGLDHRLHVGVGDLPQRCAAARRPISPASGIAVAARQDVLPSAHSSKGERGWDRAPGISTSSNGLGSSPWPARCPEPRPADWRPNRRGRGSPPGRGRGAGGRGGGAP